MDADGYFMLVQNMEQCQVSEESRSQWTMTIYGNASTKDITNYRLLVTRDRFPVPSITSPASAAISWDSNYLTAPSTSWAIDQQHKPDAHIKSH